MLSKISALTAAITAVLNALVLLEVVNLSVDQIAGINLAVVAVGTLIHTWMNPAVPFGNTGS